MRIAAAQQPPGRRLAMPRLVAAFALFVVSAAAFCVIAGFVLLRQADDRQEAERRAVLAGMLNDIRASGADLTRFDPRLITVLERTAGLKNLRFAAEPPAAGREMQSVLDSQGRIAGWFSWELDRSMGDALDKLRPLLAVTGLGLIGFAGVAFWLTRGSIRALAASERLAWRLAHQDMLTGLPNHRKMIELIDAALVARRLDESVSLALIDVDGLGDVNDAHGRAAGDALLAAFARRLNEKLPQRAAAGRFDGDQFAVVMTTPDAAAAQDALAGLAEALARPYWIDGQAVQVGATVGFTQAPQHAGSRDELARRADLALRAAKGSSRGGMSGFDPALDRAFDDRRFIERELKRALAEDLLDVHYQPIVTADGARIVAAEALLRWQHPVRGAIPPAEFVPVAEQCGLMGPLGTFVLRRALADAGRWPGISIAVNLSPVQVRDPALVGLVSDLLIESGIAPERLMLEVTEGVLIDKPGEAKARLDALHALGVKLALDDFGTGYSSLSYLQRFRFDKLKIDRSFVVPLGQSPESGAMVQAIVALGRALGLCMLAEGVETEEQRVLLRLAGCEELQGYLFARPGPREALDRLLQPAQTAMRAS